MTLRDQLEMSLEWEMIGDELGVGDDSHVSVATSDQDELWQRLIRDAGEIAGCDDAGVWVHLTMAD